MYNVYYVCIMCVKIYDKTRVHEKQSEVKVLRNSSVTRTDQALVIIITLQSPVPGISQTPFYQKIILKIKKMMPKNNFPFYVPLNQPFLFILTVMFAFTFRCLRSHDYFKITGSEFWKRDSNFVRVTMSRHEPFLL